MSAAVKTSRAGDCYKHGCNCAEALVHAFKDRFPFPVSDDVLRIATCFGDGAVGEAGFCGAFTGATMTLSLFVGRSGPAGAREPAYTYAREFGARFIDAFGADTCKALQVHAYASPDQKANCGRIVATTGDLMAEFLAEKKLLRK